MNPASPSMNRPALLLSLLALAAAPARAEDPATNAPPPAAATNVPAALKSPIVMRGVMASRTPGERGKALRKYSMPEESPSKAQLRAKRWLKSIQLEDGSWPGTPAAATALALLAYYSSLTRAGGERRHVERAGVRGARPSQAPPA